MPADETTATAQAGYGRAFGRIVVIEQGEERTLSIWDDFRVRVRSLKSDQKQSIHITGDGSFNWPLKPGDYVLQAFSYRAGNVRLWTSFSIPEAERAAYIGDLRVTFDRGRFEVSMADQYERALEKMEGALGDAKSKR